MAKAPAKTPAPTSSPRPRLGADLAAAPKLSREPVSLIVAKTDIVGGKVRLRLMAKSPVTVARGQVVHVKHTYRLQEHSEDREEYRFLLKSRLDGKDHAPSLARLGDQWGVPEDISGYLQHEYKFQQAGRHRLDVEVGAEYTVMDWGDTEVQALERDEATATLEIVVV